MPAQPLRHRLHLRLAAWAVVVGGSVLATFAAAQSFEPGEPAMVVVGTPMGHAPQPRLDEGRTGQSGVALPGKPQEVWRRELAGGLDHPPAVDAEGSVIAALSSQDLVKLGPDGRHRWHARLEEGTVGSSPVLTSDGSAVVVTSDGALWKVGADGQLRWLVDLGMPTKQAGCTPLALDDGSVVVAGEDAVVVVGQDGTVTARASLPGPADGGILRRGSDLYITGQSGVVLRWRPPLEPHPIGDFGGRIEGGGVLVGPRTLVATLTRREVLALDLETGQRRLLAGGPGSLSSYEGPPTRTASGELWITSVAGELLVLDAQGALLRHTALENANLIFGQDGGAALPSLFGRIELRPSPPLVADPAGRVGFVRASGRVGVVGPDGVPHLAVERFCTRPLAVLPAGPGRMYVACREGSVGLFADP